LANGGIKVITIPIEEEDEQIKIFETAQKTKSSLVVQSNTVKENIKNTYISPPSLANQIQNKSIGKDLHSSITNQALA
jgi:hypothetical protein